MGHVQNDISIEKGKLQNIQNTHIFTFVPFKSKPTSTITLTYFIYPNNITNCNRFQDHHF